MANRESTAVPGDGLEAITRALIQRIIVLERQVAELQTRGDQMLPADFRFKREVVGGGYAVVIYRVSTEAEEQITGPL